MCRNFNIVFLFAAVLTLWSCEKDSAEADSYILFGHFYSECDGEECLETYKLTDVALYEDLLDDWSGVFDFSNSLPEEKRAAVADLPDFIPAELLTDSRMTIGQPDAGDWGGIYFEIKNSSLHRHWILDQNESNMSQSYNSFVDKINEKIALIHQ